MTRLTRYVHHSGFYMFLGALLMLLILRHVYVRVEKKQPKPADNVLQYEEKKVSGL